MSEDDSKALLSKLHSTLTTQPIIDSVSIVEIPDSIVLECGHVGISKRTFKRLALYAYAEFNTMAGKPDSPERTCALEQLSSVLILLNPDDNRFWIYRRRLLQDSIDFNVLKSELWIASHPLKLKPKSPEPFNHLRWLLHNNRTLVTEQMISNQLKLCQETATNYKQNYYSWTHRIWIIRNFQHLLNFEDELSSSMRWIETHISDFSGMSYRFSLLLISFSQDEKGGNYKKNMGKTMISEIIFMCENIRFYPEHEALWSYLRMLFLFCEANKVEYIKKCKDKLCAIEKIKNRYANNFRENLIINNLFGISL